MSEISKQSKGGLARQASMTPEQRKEAASNAARAKVELSKLPKATHGAENHPLKIGEVEIPCYVLADGRRVIVQKGMLTALDMSQGTAGKGGGDRIAKFAGTKGVSSQINNDLMKVINSPVYFVTPNGSRAYGYEATVLADLCDAVLEARKVGEIHYQQAHIAVRCEMLVRAFARVGIIALVDEATGYQKDRAKDALAKILEAYVAKELQPWIKTFDADYYEGIFRLRGLPYPPETKNLRPQYFGKLTNDIVYRRLAPGILKALKTEGAKAEKKGKMHQHLTAGYGRQELLKHLGSVVTMMRLSKEWPDFMEKLNHIAPRFGNSYALELEESDR